jgi:hypothetical protein
MLLLVLGLRVLEGIVVVLREMSEKSKRRVFWRKDFEESN